MFCDLPEIPAGLMGSLDFLETPAHDFLIVKADRCEPLIVPRLKLANEIAAIAKQGKKR